MKIDTSRGARGFLRVFLGLALLFGAAAAQAQPTVPGGLSLTQVAGASTPTLSFTWNASTGGFERTDYVVQLRELPAAFPSPAPADFGLHSNAWPDYATVTSGLDMFTGDRRYFFPEDEKTARWVVFANLRIGKTYEVRIVSEDAVPAQSAWSATVQIDVCPCSLAFASAQDEVRMHGGASASVTLPAAKHGTSPYSYGLNTLPTGLAFNKDTRTISGTPAAVSSVTTSNMNYVVVDSSGTGSEQTFDIQVAPALTFASAPPAQLVFVRNTASPNTLPEISGGFTPYAYSLEGGALPGGLTFTAATRILSGAPSAAADATFTYTAKDALGAAGVASGILTSDIRIRVLEFDLDVDNSGAITAQDGIMIARHLLGAEAASVIANQSGTAAATVAGNIQDGVDLGLLDVDADNDTDGNDGIMVARYILGLRGDELVAGMGDAVAATVEGKMAALTP
ncbi:MAG: putative Ig domain-containing protein [Gammaproteobacteria bacterium]|nr:putative Ig domain-containing protein [Gammaproteobacteria bacterium]